MWIKRAGKARVTYAGGSTYEGDFNDEKMKDGTGKYVWMEAGEEDEEPKEKAVYEGQYKDGKRTGTGTMRYPNKDEYTGEWKENKMHGTGTYKYAKSQDIYSGSFVDGAKDGEGCYEFGADSSKLKGTWSAGKFVSGEWLFKTSDSSKPYKFAGDFANGQPTGAGAYTFPNGIVQAGSYEAKPLGEDAEEGAVPETKWVGEPVYAT